MQTPLTCAALLLAAALWPGGADARSLSGSLSYPERIALPDGAEVVIELRGRAGFLVAETRFATGGRQVPFDFAFDDLPEIGLDLRAAVFDAGRPIRLSETVEVAAGTEDLQLAPVRLAPHVAMGFASRLRCGTLEVELGFLGGQARLRIGEQVLALDPDPAASGARFVAPQDAGTWVWTRGDRALISLAGEELPECRLAIPDDLLPFTALGHEPAWRLDLQPETLRFTTDLGATVIETALPEPDQSGGTIRFATPDSGLEAVLEPALCRDIATGMPHPYAVTVRWTGADLAGCGGDPLALTRGIAWHLLDIAGTAVPPDWGVTFYLAHAEVGGHGPCNYYFGDVTLTGEGIRFGPMAVTRRICDEPRMVQERQLLEVLNAVTRFDFTDTGELVLYADGERRVIAGR